MFSKIARSLKGSLGNLAREENYSPTCERECSSVVSDLAPSHRRRNRKDTRRFSQMLTSDLEVEKTEFHDRYRYSSLNHLAAPAGDRRATIQVSGRGLEQVQSNMAGIQNSILNTTTSNNNNNNTIIQLRRQLEERNKTIKKLREDRNTSASTVMKRRTVGQEINLLKTFLGDKISSISQMKEELKYKDIDSNTMDGVRNVNELEYKIEKYHKDMINISQRLTKLMLKQEKESQSSLFSLVQLQTAGQLVVLGCQLTREELRATKLSYDEGCGLEVRTSSSPHLRPGDKIVEVNSELLLQIDRAGWHSLRPGLTCPCHVVVIRNISTQTNREIGEILGFCDQHHDSEMEERIKMMQTKLELKLEEGRNVNQELSRAREEKLKTEQENTRLRHRICYLEEVTSDMQEAMKVARQSLCQNLGLDSGSVSSSSSGVSCDLTSEDKNLHSLKPPPKPARQFLDYSTEEEALYENKPFAGTKK